MIDRVTIDKIMDAAQIVDVVSDFVTLKRSGANYKGLCPFHDDRTPSFMVSPSKNFCKCFACGVGGNPVTFIMKHEQISYPDALRWLAKKYGITIQEKELSKEERAAQTDKESMYILNNWAREWFTDQLYNTDDGKAIGMAYFRGRGFRDDIIKKFQLGFCPNRKDNPMSTAALKAGYQERYLVSDPETGIGTGLSLKNAERGTLRDRFFGRVMWPIFTVGGKVAGFGGRVLDAATKGVAVKYQNSPESIIYSKKKELFGLFHAKQAIVKQGMCYLVEGYTDVMAMHQSGVENVVASSGTALTEDQIRLIHRFTSNITVIYDGDAAGIKASQRGIDMLLAQGMNVKLLLLPDGDDPDSFSRKHNAEEFQGYLKDHQVDFIKFKADLVMKEAQGNPNLLSDMVSNIIYSISVIRDEITRIFYIREIANMVNLPEKIIGDRVAKQVQANLEEWRKEKERKEHLDGKVGEQVPRQEQPQEPIPGTTVTSTPPVVSNDKVYSKIDRKLHECEELLIQAIVRNGEKTICKVEDDEGKEQELTLTEFIAVSLQQDNLELSDDLHKRMLNEALEHAHEKGWKAERYFLNNADQEMSSHAFDLASDKEERSRLHEEMDTSRPECDRLMDHAVHVLTDFKLAIIEKEKSEIERELHDKGSQQDKSQLMSLLRRFKEIKEIETRLAKQCGDRVIMKTGRSVLQN